METIVKKHLSLKNEMRLSLQHFPIFFLGLFFTSCTQPNSNISNQQSVTIPVADTADFAVIPFDQKREWPFKHTYIPAPLSEEEIQNIDKLLKKCVSDYSKKLAARLRSDYSIDFDKYNYKKQYMAVFNDKGEKEVWVNGFCDTWDKNWKTDIILVQDGGNCYFSLKINLTSGECFEVSVNGYA